MAFPTASEREHRRRAEVSGASWGFIGFLSLLILLFLPVWPYSTAWGYYPATGFGFALVVFLIAMLLGAFIAADRPPTNKTI